MACLPSWVRESLHWEVELVWSLVRKIWARPREDVRVYLHVDLLWLVVMMAYVYRQLSHLQGYLMTEE